jgi:serine/threonine-protein kinase
MGSFAGANVQSPSTSSILRFTVLGELALGGMGRIDLARCVDGRTGLIAVKRLHAHLAADTDSVHMFLDEARVTGALQHPNLIALVGFGEDEEGLFLATEYVHGPTLAHIEKATRVAGERIPQELIAYIGARVASGLAAVHSLVGADGASLGIVHRDISPSNILVGINGDVKIADFGVAKATFAMQQTQSGILKGKLHYMSPEYACGETIDWRADLFSLGVVLFQIASGTKPFDGEHEGQVLRALTQARPTPLAQAVPGIDPQLARIIERLLSRDPAMRAPKGAAALSCQLDLWLASRGHDVATLVRRLGAHAQTYGGQVLEKAEAFLRVDGSREQEETVMHLSVDDAEEETHVVEPRTVPWGLADSGFSNVPPEALYAPLYAPPAPLFMHSPPATELPREPREPREPRDVVTARRRVTRGVPAWPWIAAVGVVALVAGLVGGLVPRTGHRVPPREPRVVAHTSFVSSVAMEKILTPSALETVSATPEPTPTAPPTAPAISRPRSQSQSQSLSAPAPAPPPTQAKAHKRSCTSLDFDYPTCLQ